MCACCYHKDRTTAAVTAGLAAQLDAVAASQRDQHSSQSLSHFRQHHQHAPTLFHRCTSGLRTSRGQRSILSRPKHSFPIQVYRLPPCTAVSHSVSAASGVRRCVSAQPPQQLLQPRPLDCEGAASSKTLRPPPPPRTPRRWSHSSSRIRKQTDRQRYIHHDLDPITGYC